MEACKMEFSGRLLKRGFWLYIWDIKEEGRRHLYVGRTGDTSSKFASSPFRRIGQHLDTRLNAKGNALGKHLRDKGIDPESCTFEMVAIGPLFEEQNTLEAHRPLRDKTAAMESALAKELKSRGYDVLGTHPVEKRVDEEMFCQVIAKLQAFPAKEKPMDWASYFKPVKLSKPGPMASDLIIQERGEK